MTESLRISGPQDIINIVPRLLGFVPTESLVVVGVGQGVPFARLDLDCDPVAAFAETSHLWDGAPTFLLVYTETPERAAYIASLRDLILPGAKVFDVIQVTPDAVVGPTGNAATDARRVAPTREALRDLYNGASDEEIETIAVAAYANGQGALARIGLDIATERGYSSPVLERLEIALNLATRPTDVVVARILGEEQ